jgi:hypothetical protein
MRENKNRQKEATMKLSSSNEIKLSLNQKQRDEALRARRGTSEGKGEVKMANDRLLAAPVVAADVVAGDELLMHAIGQCALGRG